MNRPKTGYSTRIAGFTLIEMAMVMLIVGMMLSGLFSSLGQSTENKRRTDAAAQLARVDEALYGYAQTYGRLPCPATDASAGVEAPVGGGVCTAAHGFVPYVTLGLQSAPSAGGLMMDPWQTPLRYSVATLLSGGNRAFTSVAGMRNLFATGATLTPLDPLLLCVSDTPACAGVVAASTVPALVLSMGGNGPEFSGASSAQEQENAGALLGGINVPGDNQFVIQGYSELNFDDLVVYLSPNLLFGRLISAGRLP